MFMVSRSVSGPVPVVRADASGGDICNQAKAKGKCKLGRLTVWGRGLRAGD